MSDEPELHVHVDRVGDELLVYVEGVLRVREPFPVPPAHVKDRSRWLSLYALKALGMQDARDPRDAGE